MTYPRALGQGARVDGQGTDNKVSFQGIFIYVKITFNSEQYSVEGELHVSASFFT
jgi:hypothetical protein